MNQDQYQYTLHFFYDYVFPNYKLANALIPELGIINYMHSMNSNRLSGHGFFEQVLPINKDSSVLDFMFDGNLGHWPNSVTGDDGTHLRAGPYLEMLRCVDDAVFFGKRRGIQKYIYPIKVSPHINDFSGVTHAGSRVNGEFFWKFISEEVIKDVRNRRALIFLDYAQENYIQRENYERLHKALEYADLPKEQIILAYNSYNAKEIYEYWFPENERRMEVHNWPFVVDNTSYWYTHANVKLNRGQIVTTRFDHRPNYFLFKIRRPREWRLALLFQLYRDNLLSKGDWSCLADMPYEEYRANELKERFKIDISNEMVQEIYKLLPHSLEDEKNGSFTNTSSWTDSQLNSYKKAYFYIATETFVEGNFASLTEKIFKPIANFMPFVFVSFPGALKLLRSLGFQTFSDFIDEDYDKCENAAERLSMIYKEIRRLCSMNKEEIHTWYWKMMPILEHNHDHLIGFYSRHDISKNFINYLSQRMT